MLKVNKRNQLSLQKISCCIKERKIKGKLIK